MARLAHPEAVVALGLELGGERLERLMSLPSRVESTFNMVILASRWWRRGYYFLVGRLASVGVAVGGAQRPAAVGGLGRARGRVLASAFFPMRDKTTESSGPASFQMPFPSSSAAVAVAPAAVLAWDDSRRCRR